MSSDDDEDNFAIYGTPLEEIDEGGQNTFYFILFYLL